MKDLNLLMRRRRCVPRYHVPFELTEGSISLEQEEKGLCNLKKLYVTLGTMVEFFRGWGHNQYILEQIDQHECTIHWNLFVSSIS